MAKPIHLHLGLARFASDIATYAEIAPKEGFGIEFQIHGDELDDWQGNGVRAALTQLTRSLALPLTLHGPIFGFDPASRDKATRELAKKRVLEAFETVDFARPSLIVFHSSYNNYSHAAEPQRFIDDTCRFWDELLGELPKGSTLLALENIYDADPRPLAAVLDALSHPRLGFCFDIGHWNCFGRQLELDDYLALIGRHLIHLHLHDNHGAHDSHLPAGQGSIDFSGLWRFLAEHPRPFSLTVEGKTIADNLAGARYVQSSAGRELLR